MPAVRGRALAVVLAASCLLAKPMGVMAGDIIWTNLSGGSWATAANWSPNQVPAAIDTAFITNDLAITVTIGAAASVSNLFLGTTASALTNRLDQNAALSVHGTARVGGNGWFRMSGQLNISNRFDNSGFFQWLDSPMRGKGMFVNAAEGFLQTRSSGVSTLGLPLFNNFGRFQVGSDDAGVQFASNVTFSNLAGGEVQLNLPCLGIQNAAGATNTIFINHGLVRATASASFCPSYLTVDLINYGTLSVETRAWYIGAGTNYGAVVATAGLRELSTVSTDPFVFETGTVFSSPAPDLYAGGFFMFNTPLTLDAPRVHVGDASDGASTASPALTINADLAINGDVSVTSGRINILNPAASVFMKDVTIADNNVGGDASPYITNAANLVANTFAQSFSTTDNAGTLTVRSNLSFNAGTFRSAGGVIVLEASSTAAISGGGAKNINGQSVVNHGVATASATVNFANGATWLNETGSVFNANGGTLNDNGTAGAFLNRGTFQRTTANNSTATDLQFTNAGGLVSARNGILGLTHFTQTSGRTELRGGSLGGSLTLLGGTLDGAGDVGVLINGSGVAPGNPIGTIRATGSITNLAGGAVQMQIAGGNSYDRFNAAGPVTLAGTLNVLFTNGFFPVMGNTFTAMTYTARSGVFDNIAAPNYEFEVIYTPTNLLLRASNALPSLTFTAGGGSGTQAVCQPFQLVATAADLDGAITNISLRMNGSTIASAGGPAATTSVELDYPTALSFVAEAVDNRGGTTRLTQDVAVVAYPLHVLNLGGFRENGAFKICMAGEQDRMYDVIAATNLPATNWVLLGPMENTNGIWRYFDSDATNFPRRFYRSRQVHDAL